MGGKVVVTYKRKRLFSKSDHSPINVHSDKPPDVSELKTSAGFDNYVVSTVERTLPSEDREFQTFHDYSKENVEETVAQCENFDSYGQCSKANESQRPCSSCPKQEDSLILIPPPESNLDSEQAATHLDVTLVVNSRERHLLDSGGQPNAEEQNLDDTQSGPSFTKLDSEYKDDCNPFSGINLETSDGNNCSRQTNETSLLGTFSSEGKTKLNKDEFLNNSVTKHKSSSPLITFCRRLKRNRDNAAKVSVSKCVDKCVSVVAPLAARFSVEPMTEKKSTDETDNPCSISGPAFEMAMELDNPLHSPRGKATNGTINKLPNFQDLLNVDVTSRSTSSNIPGTRDSLSSLDLSISPPAYRDIDCNISLDCASHENHLCQPLEVLGDCPGPNSDAIKNTSISQVTPVIDKGKFVVEPRPVKNIQHEFQLFPENPTNITAHTPHRPVHVARISPPSFHNTARALHDFPPLNPLSRHLLMLDAILARARGKIDFSTTWSEDELDCLWVGVRRHGVNNWAAILMDRKLHFSAWKTAHDLADRWRHEMRQLFHNAPVSYVRFPGPDEARVSRRLQNQSPNMNLAKRCHFQRSPVMDGCLNGTLSHWLREAVELPPRPCRPGPNVVQSVCKPNREEVFEKTQNAPVLRQDGQQTSKKPDDFIAVVSDASSEETVSDEHRHRGVAR